MPLPHSQRRIFTDFFCLLLLAGQAMTLPSRSYTRIHVIPSPKFLSRRELVQVIHTAESISSDSMLLACCTSSFVPTAFQDGSPAVRVVKACNLVANVNGGCTPEAFPPADDISDGPPSDPPPSTVTTGSTTMSSSVVSPSLATSSSSLSTSDASSSLSFSTISTIPASSLVPTPTSPSNSPSGSPSSTLVTTTLIPASSSLSIGTSETPSPSPSPSAATNSSVIRTSSSSSSPLPKVIGAFAGVSVILLIIGGTIGYLKQKKMKKGDAPILWPDTR